MSDDEEFFPTLAFGFAGTKGDTLMQLWVGNMGTQDWRKVPMIQLGKLPAKQASVAGTVPLEDEEADAD